MAYGIYGVDGKARVTEVSGATRTGLYAADGSINIVVDSALKGVYHPCGAYRVSSNTGTGLYDPTGAYYFNKLLGVGCTLAGGGGAPLMAFDDVDNSQYIALLGDF